MLGYRFRLSTVAIAALALAAGCTHSPGTQPFLPPETLSRVAHFPQGNCITNQLSFLSDAANNEIYIYNQGQTGSCETIFGLNAPHGIKNDSAHNIFVANTNGSNVLIFPPPYSGAPMSWGDPMQLPFDVAICKGYVAVTNFKTTLGGAGSVSIYKGGVLTGKLHDPKVANELFDTCDPAGDLFTDGLDSGGHTVVNEWKGGVGPVKELSSVATFVKNPGGMDWAANKLWIDDQTGLNISEWPAPFTSHTAVIPLGGAGDPMGFELNSTATRILSADKGLDKGVVYTTGGAPLGILFPFTSPGTLVGAAFNNGI